MCNSTLNSIAAATTLALAALAAGQSVTFEMIPNGLGANDMSPDGRWVVGVTDIDGDGAPDGTYRWDTVNDVLLTLPAEGLDANAVSNDGQIVLGTMIDLAGDEVAGIWTAATGWQSLGYLPNAGMCPSRSNGYELSADGTVAVGLSWDGCSGRGFRWTQATGMIELENLANGSNRASVVSADGNVIGGFAQGMSSRTPAMWDSVGVGALLDPPSGVAIGEVFGLSDDGSVLLVTWDGDAARWTTGGGLEILGNGQMIPGWAGRPLDIADDGTVVGFDSLLGNRRAWIQPQGAGLLRDFKTFVTANGGAVPDGLILEVCQAISTDGRYVIGHGFGTGAWRVTITPDCAGDTNNSGAVDIDDIVNVVLCFGTDGIDCPNPGDNADVNQDGSSAGVVDIDDIVTVILNFGDCPGT